MVPDLPRHRGDFVRVLFWEFVQNLPLVAGLLMGLWLWQQGRPGPAIACIAAGSAGGALAIWATESRIVTGHREPWRVVITNAMGMGVLGTLLVVYLSAPWSRWWTDLGLGLAAAALMGIGQDLAAGSAVDWAHCLALALAFALILICLRVVANVLPLWLNVFFATAIVTLAVALIDYGPFHAKGTDHSVL